MKSLKASSSKASELAESFGIEPLAAMKRPAGNLASKSSKASSSKASELAGQSNKTDGSANDINPAEKAMQEANLKPWKGNVDEHSEIPCFTRITDGAVLDSNGRQLALQFTRKKDGVVYYTYWRPSSSEEDMANVANKDVEVDPLEKVSQKKPKRHRQAHADVTASAEVLSGSSCSCALGRFSCPIHSGRNS